MTRERCLRVSFSALQKIYKVLILIFITMPYRDKTGPEGKGPLTGRQQGLCKDFNSFEIGKGLGKGVGKIGRGLGRFGRGFRKGIKFEGEK